MSSDFIEIKQENGAEEKSAPSSQLVYPSDDFLALFGVTPSASGITVSPITAMRVPAVNAAVKAISEALGQVDANVYSVSATGDNEIASTHPAYTLLNGRVNGWTSGSKFREQLTRDALLYGNGYAAITRDEGVPVELNHLEASRMALLRHPVTMEPAYQYSPDGGEQVIYPYSEIIHLCGASFNGVFAESVIYEAREAIALALVMEAHAARLFKNGARPGGTLNVPGKLTVDAKSRINASLAAQSVGAASGRSLVLEEGMEFKPLSFSSVDSQFLELRTFAVSEIARVFRISPILLGEMGRATFANSAEMGRQFICFTLAPWVKRWEAEIALKLFNASEVGKLRVELDTDQFDRIDLNTRAAGYGAMIAARVMNPNECRALEGLPPYTGGEVFINPNIANVQENVNVG